MTSCLLSIEHRTGYEYRGDVLASYNEARLTPAEEPGQRVLRHDVTVQPGAPVFSYRDYFGTVVHAFDLHDRHEHLAVLAHSIVERDVSPDLVEPVSWDVLSDAEVRDEYVEWLVASPLTTLDGPVLATAAEELRALPSPAECVAAVSEWTRTHVTYEPGATTVATTAADAVALGRGVCQDYVHVALALLRAVGVPARYTSGYLHSHPEAPIGTTSVGESHAWLDAWLGRWCPIDPTNGAPVAERHVAVARGRDYADVAPLKGVYHGAAVGTVDVRVAITRIA